MCFFVALQFQQTVTLEWLLLFYHRIGPLICTNHHSCAISSLYRINTLQWRHNGRDSVSKTSLTIVYSAVYSDADQRKHQSSASLAFVQGIHRGPVNSPHKWPVTRKMFLFDDVIMKHQRISYIYKVTIGLLCLTDGWHLGCVLISSYFSQKGFWLFSAVIG